MADANERERQALATSRPWMTVAGCLGGGVVTAAIVVVIVVLAALFIFFPGLFGRGA